MSLQERCWLGICCDGLPGRDPGRGNGAAVRAAPRHPGGPFRNLIGEAVGADPAAAEHAEALLGLDRPPLERYLGWARRPADRRLRRVVGSGAGPGRAALDDRARQHAVLTGSALLLALVLGGLIGVASALRPGSAAGPRAGPRLAADRRARRSGSGWC